MKVIEKHKLFSDTYLVVFDTCVAIAKTDEEGNIIRVSTFGERKEHEEKRS